MKTWMRLEALAVGVIFLAQTISAGEAPAEKKEAAPQAQAAAVPANADIVPFEPGKEPPVTKGWCWCLMSEPAKFKTVTEEVEVAPATNYLEIVPAKWQEKEVQVQVEPEKKIGKPV
ncbi:MAG: hypothetical protein N3A66_11550, partial [Planctomycetota bacterium]|nr:hypothetical protein [Planctomycetota bacterium]